MRFQTRDAPAALQQSVNRAERLADDFRDAHEPAPNAFFRELKDLRFGIVQNFFCRIALFGCASDCGGGCVNQSAEQRLVADNADVVLDARAVGNAVKQPSHVRRSADRL